MHPILNIAVRAARAAGDLIVRELDRVGDLAVDSKGRHDFVTEVDRRAEQLIIETVQRTYPDHAFLAEESGASGEGDLCWIIDPLDGTTNFVHGFPHFAVSIAFQNRQRIEQAVIYDPLKQELFMASYGEGAQLNNRKIRTGNKHSLDGALLGTGFSYKKTENLDEFLAGLKRLFPMIAGIRRAGAASLDMAYVACGRLDGFWEYGLKPWDIAAGALIVQEAGGINSDMTAGTDYLLSGDIVSANPRLLKLLLQALHPAK